MITRQRASTGIIFFMFIVCVKLANGNSLDIAYGEIVYYESKKLEQMSEKDRNYVIDNCYRKDIEETILSWQRDKNIKIIRKALIAIVLDYMINEHFFLNIDYFPQDHKSEEIRKVGMVALKKYLDDVYSEERVYNIKNYFPFLGVAFNAFPSWNEYGRLNVQSIPNKAEIHIDGRFVEYTDNEFVVTIGEHTILVVKTPEYEECKQNVTIIRGKKHDIECKLFLRKK